MHAIATVFLKEIKDSARDRRAVLSAFIFPFMAPILVYGLVVMIVQITTEREETVIPVVGAEHAPTLILWMEEQGIKFSEFSGDPAQAVRDKTEKFVLVIPESFSERLGSIRSAMVEIYHDGSRQDTLAEYRLIDTLVRKYNSEIASLRLIARGVSPEVMRVVVSQGVDVASKQQLAVAALSFLPLYVLLAAFVSGMGVAVDTTAGERERKTLEALLVNPVVRHEIVFGKWLAAGVFSSLGMVMTLSFCVTALMYAPLDQIGLKFDISTKEILLISIAILPTAFLIASLQMLVGIFAQSFKDAQSYIGLLTMIPIAPYFVMMLNPFAPQDWMYVIPMLSQLLLMTDILGMKQPEALAYAYAFFSSLSLGALLALTTARFFERESII